MSAIPQSKRSYLPVALGAILVFTLASIFGFYTYNRSGDGAVKALSSTSLPSFLAMEPLIVNLADTDTERYLQISIVVETENDEIKNGLLKIEPMLRSRSMMVLTSKSSALLRTPEGKQNLRNEILDLIQVSMADAGVSKREDSVKDVHFSTFVIQ